ncbi:MAG: methylenetetrahydrofolate reductase, partial [Bacteroidota bacterium]|nr:methylenetetrahydrofolate reductase [Bacteroidota bacterium]
HVNFPESFSNELEKCKTDEEIKRVGIEWTTAQCKELVKADIPVIHFYTMGRGTAVKNIAKEIF